MQMQTTLFKTEPTWNFTEVNQWKRMVYLIYFEFSVFIPCSCLTDEYVSTALPPNKNFPFESSLKIKLVLVLLHINSCPSIGRYYYVPIVL